MSGQKGMKHFGNAIIEGVLWLINEGKTNRESAELLGLKNAHATKNLIQHYRRKQEQLKSGIFPKLEINL